MDSSDIPFGCFFPLHAIAVHPQGHPHFCLTSDLKTAGDLRELQTHRHAVHSEFKAGRWPASCRRCQKKEAAGQMSRRTQLWQRKTRLYNSVEAARLLTEQETLRVRHLEISFSNVCNLTCAMCSSEFSTSWARLDALAESEGLSFRTRPYRRITKISPQLLEEILEHSADLDLIIVKGGEPTRDPLCLEFLVELQRRRRDAGPIVFIQTNGTRPPDEWLPQLKNLRLEIGFSLDGWSDVYDWIRGTSFATVLSHLHMVHATEHVQAVSIDFTLSLFNSFHLEEFFTRVLELKGELPKLRRCPVGQWMQQPYGSAQALNLRNRLQVVEKIRPLLTAHSQFFLNCENLLDVMTRPQLPMELVDQAERWYEFISRARGRSLERFDAQLRAALIGPTGEDLQNASAPQL